jgi:hypothetical protein
MAFRVNGLYEIILHYITIYHTILFNFILYYIILYIYTAYIIARRINGILQRTRSEKYRDTFIQFLVSGRGTGLFRPQATGHRPQATDHRP